MQFDTIYGIYENSSNNHASCNRVVVSSAENARLHSYAVVHAIREDETRRNKLTIIYFTGVEAMQCYQCNSRNNSQCADNKPPDTMKIDCSDLKDGAKYTMCRKITQVIEFSVNGRTCVDILHEDFQLLINLACIIDTARD